MFNSEKELVDEAMFLLRSPSSEKVPLDLKGENQIVLQEVNLGYGIADIVLTNCTKSTEKRDRYLNQVQIKLLIIINNNPGIALEEIENRTKLRKKAIIDSISFLEELSLVKRTQGNVNPFKSYALYVQNTIAIEAKLKNWKRALKQAYRYKWFSHKSFVCLPSNKVPLAVKNIKEFKKMGVGLIGFCQEQGFQIIYNPRVEDPISDEMTILLNELVLNSLHASS